MARVFDDASSQYLEWNGAAPLQATPFAMACFFISDNDTAMQTLMFLGDKDAIDHYCALFLRGDVANDPIAALHHKYGGGSFAYAYSDTPGYAANVQGHACGMWVSDSERRAYADGVKKGDETTALSTPHDNDAMAIGGARDSSPGFYMSGQIWWPAMWDLSVYPGATAANKADYFEANVLPGLAAGWHPRCFPLGLIDVWPLGGLEGNHDRGIWGRHDMTAAGGPTWTDHPGGLTYPTAPLVVIPTAAPGGLSIPIAMRHYMQMQGAG